MESIVLDFDRQGYSLRIKCGHSLPRGKEGALVIAAGILGTLGYCIAVWAMSLTTMGGVSAIREASILFAALIGTFVLREKMTLQKFLGAITVTGGVVCLSL